MLHSKDKTPARVPGTTHTMVQQILVLGLYIIITVCFLEVRGQGTPVLTIAQSPIIVGDGELKCQIEKVAGYATLTYRVQQKQADSSYTTIATINFQRPSDTIVNDAVLGSRSNAVLHDPSTTTFFAGSLQIRDVICIDAGMYRCETEVLNFNTGLGSSLYSIDVELVIIELPSENPRLSYSPSEINVGDAVQFACNGNVGRPAVDLSIAVSIGSLTPERLRLTGSDLTAAGDNCTYIRRVTASRIFTRSEAKAGVIVQCNVMGYTPLVHQRPLDIKYAVGDVEITSDSSSSLMREIAEGRQIIVRCQSDGNPIASHKISFIRVGDTGITQAWSENSLVIRSLEKTDAGIYFCTARNTLSAGHFTDASQNITLTVTDLGTTATSAAATARETESSSTSVTLETESLPKPGTAGPVLQQNQLLQELILHQTQLLRELNLHQNQLLRELNLYQNQLLQELNLHQTQLLRELNLYQNQLLRELNLHQHQLLQT